MPYENTSDVNRWWLLPETMIRLELSYKNEGILDSSRRTTIRFYQSGRAVKNSRDRDADFLYWKAFLRGEQVLVMKMKPIHHPTWDPYNTDIEFSVESGEKGVIKGFEKDFEYWANILSSVGESEKLSPKMPAHYQMWVHST
jgi:hypothetical protein